MKNEPRDLTEDEIQLKRDIAEEIRTALIEYLRSCNEKPPELLAAVEFLGMEIRRLGGEPKVYGG